MTNALSIRASSTTLDCLLLLIVDEGAVEYLCSFGFDREACTRDLCLGSRFECDPSKDGDSEGAVGIFRIDRCGNFSLLLPFVSFHNDCDLSLRGILAEDDDDNESVGNVAIVCDEDFFSFNLVGI